MPSSGPWPLRRRASSLVHPGRDVVQVAPSVRERQALRTGRRRGRWPDEIAKRRAFPGRRQMKPAYHRWWATCLMDGDVIGRQGTGPREFPRREFSRPGANAPAETERGCAQRPRWITQRTSDRPHGKGCDETAVNTLRSGPLFGAGRPSSDDCRSRVSQCRSAQAERAKGRRHRRGDVSLVALHLVSHGASPTPSPDGSTCTSLPSSRPPR
jgi:hypothetical protein